MRGYAPVVTTTVTTFTHAARITGMSPAALASRVARGTLAPGPWTVEQLEAHIAAHPRQVRTPPPATPTSMWRSGIRTTTARIAHNRDTRDRRRTVADELLPPTVRQEILTRVTAGEPLGDVLDDLGIPQQRVWHRCRRDGQWATRLERALLAGRDPSLPHGTYGAHKRGCRCRDCRIAHRGAPTL